MRLFFLSVFSLVLALAACGGKGEDVVPPEPPKPEAPKPRTVRVLVVPFQDLNKHDETAYVSMGLAVFATARLEELSRSLDPAKGLKLEAVVGPHTYPAEAAKLRADRHKAIENAAVFAEAKRTGATHVLTGSYGGRVEKWTLNVELYRVSADTIELIGAGAETRAIFAWAKDAPDPKRPGHQMPWIHAMFGGQLVALLSKDGVTVPGEAVVAFATPQAPDASAFIRLSEAYAALLLIDEEKPANTEKEKEAKQLAIAEAKKLALAKAESAIRIWPEYQIGLRLYAWLLWQHHQNVAARKQFNEALVRDPIDVRALIALGGLEIEEKQYVAAREALQRAVKLRPDDAVIHFWLGEAHAKIGDIAEAIARYERSRELDPTNLGTHRALAGLYAGQRRYDDAAAELAVIVDGESKLAIVDEDDKRKKLDTVFLLAACLRAAGKPEPAIEAYAKGSVRFPAEPRLHKFRGDLWSELNRDDEAVKAYAEAKRLAPKDARWSASDKLFWGKRLVAKIGEADTVRVDMERLRSEFQLAVSDGVWDLTWKGKDACAPGRAGSAYLFARASGRTYDGKGVILQESVGGIRTSLKNGEGAALTPDELALAEELVRYEGVALTDLREMRTGYAELKPLLAKYGCGLDPSSVPLATIDAIKERNLKRTVVMPEPKARNASGISPVVPTDARRVVKFSIDNKGRQEYVMVLDGKVLEPGVEPNKPQTYATTLGAHAFCLLPKGKEAECGKPGTPRRTSDFHEGWNVIIQHLP